MAAVLGMISGIGGGMVRDVLMARVPVVLRLEIYALAAIGCSGGYRRQAASLTISAATKR